MNEIWVIVNPRTGKPLGGYGTGIRAYSSESRARIALKLLRYSPGNFVVVRYAPAEGQP